MLNKLKALAPKAIRNKQYVVFGGVILGLLVIATGLVLLNDSNAPKIQPLDDKIEKRIELSKITGGLQTGNKLLQQFETELKSMNKHVESQEQEKQVISSKIEELEKIVKQYEEQSNIDSLIAEIGQLREEITTLKEGSNSERTLESLNTDISLDSSNERKIQNYELKLDGRVGGMHSRNLNHYIAAGSYVPAVVISGVDASVGINSQSEPRPMLFRITDKARTAAIGGKVLEADIVGCTVTGAASGDLSSERVFVRLLKMACTREDNKVFETEVHGYAAGLGKAGIRGSVVSREGDFVLKSFLAGIAGSAGNGVAQKFATPSALPSGLATQSPSAKDIVNSSIGGGLSNSSNRLSEYLIQRAEQYQPVISVPAGIEVELVFNDGVYLDGKLGREDELVQK